MIKAEDWLPVSDMQAIAENDMVLFYAPEGNYAYVAGMHKQETVEKNPTITNYVIFAKAPKGEKSLVE